MFLLLLADSIPSKKPDQYSLRLSSTRGHHYDLQHHLCHRGLFLLVYKVEISKVEKVTCNCNFEVVQANLGCGIFSFGINLMDIRSSICIVKERWGHGTSYGENI